jgi:hypothetical protein
MSDDYHVTISAGSYPAAYAKLIDTLDVGAEVVWNGREEAFTVTEIESEESSLDGIGRFKKRLILENRNRENGAEFRLTFEEGTDGISQSRSSSLDARCHVQRQIGENAKVNPHGWGTTEDIESLSLVNPLKAMEVEA